MYQKTRLIPEGDFNLFFDSKLNAQVGNPTIKNKSLTIPIEHEVSEI